MNRIDKNNYEAYFLDYHEGRLNSEEEQSVMTFIQDNPECFDVFEDYQALVLPIPDIKYPNKSELFRTEVSMPAVDEWEYLCVAFIEGDLSDKELDNFEKERLSDPEKEKTLNTFLATKSSPDESIHYEQKAELKKKVVLIPRWIYGAVSAAAILVLGWIIFSPFGDKTDIPQMADEKNREIIYIDKLAHPGKYDRIASLDTKIKHLSNSSVTFLDNQAGLSDKGLSGDNPIERESYVMLALGSQKPITIHTVPSEMPPSSSVFAFRSIPSVEEDEYQTFFAFSGDLIRKQILKQDPALVEKSRFSLWELADAGLEKLSNIFGTNADIEREYSESGDLLAVSFESALIGFNTPIRKKSAQID